MSLSVAILAFNSASYIENLLVAVRSFADEIVIGVDTGSSDATEEICGVYADRLFRLEPIGTSERALAWLNEQCTGDWILRLDDDELPSAGLVRTLPRLLGDREYTHYALPRRWIIGETPTRWVAQHPWWPDWQIRLFRNIRSLLNYPGHLHSECLIQGAGAYLTDGSLYHYTLAYHAEKRREQRLQQYERISPNNSLPHFYFPPPAVTTRPIPDDDKPFLKATAAASPATIAQRAPVRRAPPAPYVTLQQLDDAKRQSCDFPSELFAATIDCLDCPEVVRPGRFFAVELCMRNDSAFIWRSVGLGVPQVTLSYHLLDAAGQPYEYEGVRTNLPSTLRPGEVVKVIADVMAPWEPGHYAIRWDPIIEHVSWFSTRGWSGPDTPFNVRWVPSVRPEVAILAPFLQMSHRIHGWFRREEAEALACASYGLNGNPVIVEIGCFLGSATILLAGARKLRGAGKIYCVDPFDCSGDEISAPVCRHIIASLGGGDARQHFEANMTAADLADWVEVRQGSAADGAKDWTMPIDLLVLDGDHSRAGARAAYDAWSRFLRPGGMIVLHNSDDRTYGGDHDGHRRLAVEEIVAPQYTDVELVATTTFARRAGAARAEVAPASSATASA